MRPTVEAGEDICYLPEREPTNMIARRPQADFEQVDKRPRPLAESTRCA